MRTTAIVGGVLGVSVALFGGCSKGDTTQTTSTATGSGAGGAGDKYGGGACRACVAAACATEIDACKSDPECPTFLACLDACPIAEGGDADPACVAACPTGSGTESKKAVAGINVCRESGAGAACKECGSSSAITYTAPALNQTCPGTSTDPDPCLSCSQNKCCETRKACFDDTDCAALRQCILACTDNPCVKTCTEQHLAGADLLGPHVACNVVRCATDTDQCDASKRDACVACLYGDCGDAYAYFESAPGGYAMESCINACAIDDTACDQKCYDAYPQAFEKWGDFAACVGVACKGKC